MGGPKMGNNISHAYQSCKGFFTKINDLSNLT